MPNLSNSARGQDAFRLQSLMDCLSFMGMNKVSNNVDFYDDFALDEGIGSEFAHR